MSGARVGRLLGALVLVLLAATTAAAQAPRVYRVGVIHHGGLYEAAVEGLREGLRELGWEEGKQFALIVKNTQGDRKAVEKAARELERDNVDLIYSVTYSATVAVKRATTRVPVVFYSGSDPVVMGLVESYRKPGGRLTGMHGQSGELTAKRLELLKEIVPRLRRVLTYYNPENPSFSLPVTNTREAARQLKLEVVERQVRSADELRAALDALQPGEVDAFFYVAGEVATSQTDAIIGAARAKKLPTMFSEISTVARGALAAYGPSYRVAGPVVGQAGPTHPAGSVGGRSSRRAAGEASSRPQSQDRQGDRADDSQVRGGARGRGHPVIRTGRRALLGALMLGLAVMPLTTAAQSPRVYRVGVVHFGGPYAAAVDGLREGLRELGFEEGQHYALLVRDAKGDVKAAEAAARDLERDNVDLIYSVSSTAALAVKRGTTRVPIVFYAGSDPVAIGLAESYRKPGGRLTGVHGQLTDLTAKRLELLKEIVPNLRRMVAFKVELVERPIRSAQELRSGLLALRPGEVDALFYVGDATVFSRIDVILETARARKLPTMFQEPSAVTLGGLAAYGSSYVVAGRLSAKQVQRVLQSAAPGDLPVEQLPRPTFSLNLKTAKALGLTIPRSVVLRADEVIQ